MGAGGWRKGGAGRILASFDPPSRDSGDEVIFFSLRIDNYRHIELAYGLEAAEAVHADLCVLASDLFGAGFLVGGEVYARDDKSIDIVAWRSAAVNGASLFLLETLCEGLALTRFIWGEHALHVALSIACASGREDGDADWPCVVREVLGRASPDGEAPESGGGWLLQYQHDMQTGADLLRKLDAEKVFLFWQPIVDATDSGSVLYYEALARILDPTGRPHACQESILSLERLGLIRAFDHRIVSMVLDELETRASIHLGVNISARSAVLDVWWERTRARLEADRSLGPRLIIEITETAPLRAASDVTAFMDEMRRLGCRFALDDFGTGHASFRQLLSLSPDIVKISSVFLHVDLPEQKRSTLAHLKGLAQALASVVVVEGVETEGQSRMARSLGLAWQQGHFLGAPSHTLPGSGRHAR